MEYIVGIGFIIIITIIIALVLRRRLYNIIDRLEDWKVEIMNRNIAIELSRMKELSLRGKTLKNFNEWKDRWEAILTKDLAEVKVYLFDAEAYAYRFQYSSSRKKIHKVETKLGEIETDIKSILTKLTDLLETEEASRKEVEELRPAISQMEKTLKENKQLYGKGSIRFEVEFAKLNNALITYDELIENGEYYQAKEVVDQVNKELNRVQVELAEYIDLYRICKTDLPKELKDLIKGIEGMKTDGYPVEHLGFAKKIKMHQANLLASVKDLEENGLEKSKKIIPEIKSSIEEMYSLLEKEVESRSFLETQLPVYKEELEKFAEAFIKTNEEITILRRSYDFADDDLEEIKTLVTTFEKLQTKEVSLTKQIEEKTEILTKLQVQLEAGFKQLKKLEADRKSFSEYIHMFKKDEVEARNKLEELQQEIHVTSRSLRTNNLPGIPGFIWRRIDEAEIENEKVVKILSKTPLDINAIQNALDYAEHIVNTATEEVNLLIEQAYLTERVIQYANRYRSSDNNLANGLAESERFFKNYEYELALKTAASSLESVEPGAFQKIEEQQ